MSFMGDEGGPGFHSVCRLEPGPAWFPAAERTKHRRRYAFQGMGQPSASSRELGGQRGSLSKERITDHECKREAECLGEANRPRVHWRLHSLYSAGATTAGPGLATTPWKWASLRMVPSTNRRLYLSQIAGKAEAALTIPLRAQAVMGLGRYCSSVAILLRGSAINIDLGAGPLRRSCSR
jgi:hypothetical protein